MKKPKKKVRITGIIFLLLFVYLLITLIYYFIKLPIKNISIKGNNLLTEEDVISQSKISYNDSIFKISTYKIEKNLEKNPLIKKAKIERGLNGTIIINIEENKILFLNVLTKKLVLSNEEEIDIEDKYIGYPVLINYVPSEIYKELIKSLAKVDNSNYQMISEIEYSVDKYENTVIDDERFLLRMKDGNTIYVNLINIEKLNKYQEIYSALTDKGTLYLDSSSKNYVFKKYHLIIHPILLDLRWDMVSEDDLDMHNSNKISSLNKIDLFHMFHGTRIC